MRHYREIMPQKSEAPLQAGLFVSDLCLHCINNTPVKNV